MILSAASFEEISTSLISEAHQVFRLVPPDLSDRAMARTSPCTGVEVTARSNHERRSNNGVGWERLDADQL